MTEKTSPEYKAWLGMHARCKGRGTGSVEIYLNRGIKVCTRWGDYNSFLEDMGRRPTLNHSLDRIDNNGNYEPTNCRWATPRQQNLNRRLFKNNKSGVKGVHWDTTNEIWCARGRINGHMVLNKASRKKEVCIAIRKEWELSQLKQNGIVN